MVNEQKGLTGEAEDIRDILIAISVVAKRLATKMENSKFMEETENAKKQERHCGVA